MTAVDSDYVQKLWASDCDVTEPFREVVKIHLKNLLSIDKEISINNLPFRVAGVGCGPHGNTDAFNVIVDEIRQVLPEKEIHVHIFDLFAFDQITILQKVLSKFEKVYCFISQGNIYDHNFCPDNYFDIFFQFSCFMYPPQGTDFSKETVSLCYLSGFGESKMEQLSRDFLERILLIIQNKLKNGAALIGLEAGASYKGRTENTEITYRAFLNMGQILRKYDSGLKYSFWPLFCRTRNEYVDVINRNDKVKFELVKAVDLYVEDTFGNYLERSSPDEKTKKELLWKMQQSATKPCFYDPNQPELSDKVFESYCLDYFKGETSKETLYNGGLECELVYLLKK